MLQSVTKPKTCRSLCLRHWHSTFISESRRQSG